jgi:hypothetical protein
LAHLFAYFAHELGGPGALAAPALHVLGRGAP